MSTHAPRPPGRLGVAIPAAELLAYLDGVRRWRTDRKAELDALDRAALAAADPGAHTADLTLAMSLWQAISDRFDEMLLVWDSGRADRQARERLSQLVWGRLGTPAGAGAPAASGLAVSFVEALTLSDALGSALRDRLALDPLAGAGERIAALRAALARCDDLLDEQGAGAPDDTVTRLRVQVDELAERASRGAGVSGPLTRLDAEIARTERDLIVGAARRRDLARDRDGATRRAGDLAARAVSVRALAARCTDRIVDPPRLAVPDVSALGPVPEARDELDAFTARLDRVAAALDHAEAAYAAPLATRDELRGLLGAYRAMAAAACRDDDPVVVSAWQAAHDILWTAPCDLAAARRAVDRYRQAFRTTPRGSHH